MRSDQIRKRAANRAAILTTLHYDGPQQRSSLASACEVRKASVTSIVASLLEEDLVDEVEPGRYRSAVRLRTKSNLALVASISPREIVASCLDLAGETVCIATRPVAADAGPDTILATLAAEFAAMQATVDGAVLGLGVSVPGITDPGTGVGSYAANLPGWRDVPVAAYLSDRFDLPIAVDNDVRCQLRAHIWFASSPQEVDSVLYVLVNDGVACAFAQHGIVSPGAYFAGGEIGHIRAGDRHRPCACGREDCLETYCSVPAILAEVRPLCPAPAPATATDLAAVAAKSPAVGNVLDRAAGYLAHGIAGVIAALDPAVLVIGAADHAFAECLCPLLHTRLDQELMGLAVSGLRLIAAGDAERESRRGIAATVIQNSFNNTAEP